MGCCQSRLQQRIQLLTLLLRQQGKTIPNSIKVELYTPPELHSDEYLQLSYARVPNSLLYPRYENLTSLTLNTLRTVYVTSHSLYFILNVDPPYTRWQMLSTYNIPLSAEKSLAAALRGKVVYPEELTFEVEGLRFYAVCTLTTEEYGWQVEFESDGLLLTTDDTEVKAQRQRTLAQLAEALESNQVALDEAIADRELSDVGALYLERQTISTERDRLAALPIPSAKQVCSIKVRLGLGWNLVFSTWVNVGDMVVTR